MSQTVCYKMLQNIKVKRNYGYNNITGNRSEWFQAKKPGYEGNYLRSPEQIQIWVNIWDTTK